MRFTVAPGETATVTPRFSPKAKKFLRRAGRTRVEVRATLTDPTGGPPIVSSSTFTLTVPRD
jgi:hypothetical protein